MAKIEMMWLNDGMRGRADKTSRTYTKVNSITGKTFAVTLRNPVTGDRFNNAQIVNNNRQGALWKGISIWVKQAQSADASAEDKAQLEKFQDQLRSQHKYSTLRSFIAGKRYATVAADYSSVTIADGEYTKTVEFVFNARPLIDGQEDPEFSGSTDSGNGGSTGGNSGSAETVRLTVSAGNGGKVKIGDGEYGAGANTDVAPGTSVSISAQPNAGYSFSQWSDGNTSASRSVAVNAAMTLTASFTLNSGGSGEGAGE
jgi:hypothetical protein